MELDTQNDREIAVVFVGFQLARGCLDNNCDDQQTLHNRFHIEYFAAKLSAEAHGNQ
jgi:hypothetical protein